MQSLKYLYQPSVALETTILMAVLSSLAKPRHLAAVVVSLLMLRPNERLECLISYPKVVLPILLISLLLFADSNRRARQHSFDKPLLLFIAFIAVQTVLFYPENLGANLETIATGMLVYHGCIYHSRGSAGATALSCAIAGSCLFICGEAAYYHFSEEAGSAVWQIFHTRTVDPELGRLQAWGNWGNANETAFIACLGVYNMVSLCCRSRTKPVTVAASILIPFFTLVVFLTASRTGLASLVLFFVVLMLLLKSTGGKAVVVLAILAAVSLSASFTPQRKDAAGSTEDRLDLRYKGKQLFKEHPLTGVGFRRAYLNTGGKQLHNTYLQALAETGVVGAACFLYYIYKVCRRLKLLILSSKSSHRANVAVVAGYLASALFYFLWGNQLLTLLFFLCMAQALIWMELEQDAEVEPGHATMPSGAR